MCSERACGLAERARTDGGGHIVFEGGQVFGEECGRAVRPISQADLSFQPAAAHTKRGFPWRSTSPVQIFVRVPYDHHRARSLFPGRSSVIWQVIDGSVQGAARTKASSCRCAWAAASLPSATISSNLVAPTPAKAAPASREMRRGGRVSGSAVALDMTCLDRLPACRARSTHQGSIFHETGGPMKVSDFAALHHGSGGIHNRLCRI